MFVYFIWIYAELHRLEKNVVYLYTFCFHFVLLNQRSRCYTHSLGYYRVCGKLYFMKYVIMIMRDKETRIEQARRNIFLLKIKIGRRYAVFVIPALNITRNFTLPLEQRRFLFQLLKLQSYYSRTRYLLRNQTPQHFSV